MTVQTGLDREAFERAVAESSRRPEVLLDFLTEDIEWTEIDHLTPPSSPRRYHGHGQVLEMLRGVAERGIDTTLAEALLTADRGALTIRCRYPDGRIVQEQQRARGTRTRG
jgi:hypothetical protein